VQGAALLRCAPGLSVTSCAILSFSKGVDPKYCPVFISERLLRKAEFLRTCTVSVTSATTMGVEPEALSHPPASIHTNWIVWGGVNLQHVGMRSIVRARPLMGAVDGAAIDPSHQLVKRTGTH
jgi:hypothetical protein